MLSAKTIALIACLARGAVVYLTTSSRHVPLSDHDLSEIRGLNPMLWSFGCATCASANLPPGGDVDECSCANNVNSTCILCSNTSGSSQNLGQNPGNGGPGRLPANDVSCLYGDQNNKSGGNARLTVPVGASWSSSAHAGTACRNTPKKWGADFATCERWLCSDQIECGACARFRLVWDYSRRAPARVNASRR